MGVCFVLVCAKQPFDDEYIPNIFKTILRPSRSSFPPKLQPNSLLTLSAEGKYSMPIYLSADAKNLICQMLVVNPIHSATIAGFRNYQCVEQNLPEYLEPSKEDCFDTEQV